MTDQEIALEEALDAALEKLYDKSEYNIDQDQIKRMWHINDCKKEIAEFIKENYA